MARRTRTMDNNPYAPPNTKSLARTDRDRKEDAAFDLLWQRLAAGPQTSCRSGVFSSQSLLGQPGDFGRS